MKSIKDANLDGMVVTCHWLSSNKMYLLKERTTFPPINLDLNVYDHT
jgi:hypothetical protein